MMIFKLRAQSLQVWVQRRYDRKHVTNHTHNLCLCKIYRDNFFSENLSMRRIKGEWPGQKMSLAIILWILKWPLIRPAHTSWHSDMYNIYFALKNAQQLRWNTWKSPIYLASSPGLRGEGKGRPGTHCMRMRHYSPDFGESGYVWILSVYLHRKLHVFKVMMSVSHIDATRTQPACPHGKRWVWLAILCPSLRRRWASF